MIWIITRNVQSKMSKIVIVCLSNNMLMVSNIIIITIINSNNNCQNRYVLKLINQTTWEGTY